LVSRRDLPETERLALEEFAFKYACVPESYDITVPYGHCLQTPCRQGAIDVLADGPMWRIGGS